MEIDNLLDNDTEFKIIVIKMFIDFGRRMVECTENFSEETENMTRYQTNDGAKEYNS